MKIDDVIKQGIEKFQKILNDDFFCKYDIEEFLKTNPKCSDDYIKAIAEYVNVKYKNEINIYLEIAKNYLNKDVNESIKYMEIYKSNGGINQDALMLLMKLYRDKGSTDEAIQIAENINFNNKQTTIEEVFAVCMLLITDTEKFKQQLEDILICIDNYNNKDKEEFLNQILTEILKKIKSENCENLIFIVLKNLNNLILRNKKLQVKTVLSYYLNLYMEMANKEFTNKVRDIGNSNNYDICILSDNTLQLKIKDSDIYGSEEEKIQNLLKKRYILTDSNKWQVIELILSGYKDDFLKTVEMLCEFIDGEKYFDGKLSERLTLVLRQKKLSADEKNDIIKILKKYYKKSSSIKYKNIFLNEIEILQNRTILKSKPRAIMALLTTKCNLKCVMSNVIDHKTDKINEMDTKFYNFVVANMPYLEEVVWQGVEVFLYDKFKCLSELAHKHSVKQKIITNTVYEKNILENNIENNENGHNKYEIFNRDIEEEKYKDLFCVSPWTGIRLDFKRQKKNTCTAHQIDAAKYKHDEIWNSPEMIEYRKEILNNYFFQQLKTIESNAYKSEKEKIQNLLKIFNDSRDILTDDNKWQVIELVLSCYENDFLKTVEMLCEFINGEKYFDGKLSERLTLVLRQKKLSADEKNDIIKILKKYYKKSSSIKYKNIFLNEIEILQNKIILKSKPRAIMASLTTRCNLKCIMCNVIDHKTNKINEMDSKFYNFVVANMPYLEEVVWQGGEVFLYDKFKCLSGLAYKHNVKQKIITNALLLNEDLISMLNKYRVNLQVSVDAVDKKTYEEIRVGAKFENLLNKIELLKSHRDEKNKAIYSIETVVISKNFKQLEDLVKFAIFHKFELISFLKYIVYEKNDLQLSAEQMAEVSDTIVALRNKYKNISIKTNIELDYSCEEKNKDDDENISVPNNNHSHNDIMEHKKYATFNREIEEETYKDLFCVSPWTRIYLDFNKYIRITCLSNQMDIRRYKYNEIWNSPEMVVYREKIVNSDFSNCNSLCRGCGEYTERAKIGLF